MQAPLAQFIRQQPEQRYSIHMSQQGSQSRAPRSALIRSARPSTKQSSKGVLSKIKQAIHDAAIDRETIVVPRPPSKNPQSAAQKDSPLGPFKGVSEMSMAPVSIGNSLRSSRPSISQSANSVVVTGRDFVMVVGGTQSSYVGWCLTAGFPLTPACLNASALRGYFQSYERFRFRRAVVHYITSSPTSASGDIMVVHHTNRAGPKVDHNSTNFMSYVMSTDSAVLGPQWVNHSVDILPGIPLDMCETDIFNTEDIQHQANGEVLVYTKNTTNGGVPDPPGYILIDYVVEFHNRMLNSRIQTLPTALLKNFNGSFNANGTPALGDPLAFAVTGVNTYSGVAGTAPPGATTGDIYQIVLDLTQPTLAGAVNPLNSFATTGASSTTALYSAPTRTTFPLTNGGTYYAIWDSVASVMTMYPSYISALAGNPVVWNIAGAGQQLSCPCIFSLVGSKDNTYAQANIG